MPAMRNVHGLNGFDIAFEEARDAARRGEVPIGAAILREGVLLARAGNRMREQRDPTAHAEMVAIRMACEAIGAERLIGADLYVTLEPCPMCHGHFLCPDPPPLLCRERSQRRGLRMARASMASPAAITRRRFILACVSRKPPPCCANSFANAAKGCSGGAAFSARWPA